MPLYKDTGKHNPTPKPYVKTQQGLVEPNPHLADVPAYEEKTTRAGKIGNGFLLERREIEEADETIPHPDRRVYQGVDVTSDLKDTRHYQTYVEGSKLIVTYYSQIVNVDDEGSHFSLDTPGHLQQYRRIKEYELRITSPFNASANDKGEWEGRGTAVVLPGLKPNFGDVFIADMGEGRAGVFQVESSKENSYYKDTTHEIEFSLRGYVTEEVLANLNEKSILTQVYVKDVLIFGESPYFSEERYGLRERLLRQQRAMISHYVSEFLDNEEYVFLLPVDNGRIYDHHIAELMRNIVTQDSHLYQNVIRELSVQRNGSQFDVSIWDAIICQDEFLLHSIDHQFVCAPRQWFKTPAFLNCVFYSTIEYLVFSERYVNGLNLASLRQHKLEKGYGQPTVFKSFTITEKDLEKPAKQPLIHKVNKDDYYVFTEAFYKNKTGELSVLEALVKQLIYRQPVNEQQLDCLLAECYQWGKLEKFYYFPLLILMMREVLNRA